MPMRAPNYDYRTLTLTQAQTARILYREGWNIAQLARHFSVSRQAIWTMLKKHRVTLRGRHERFALGRNRIERDDAGVTVTLRRQHDGALFSMHVPGKRLEAIQHVADTIDHAGGGWKIVSYSTPETIAADLDGVQVRSPEGQALARIDRLDLLDPEARR